MYKPGSLLPLALTLIFALSVSLSLKAQDSTYISKPVFKKGYIRLGLATFGSELDPSLSPLQNIKAGRFGAGRGYALDIGHIFYFRNRHKNYKLNYGLDLTVIHASYSKLDKWDAYAAESPSPDAYTDGGKLSVALASKLGPVIAFNPADKLVIEARFQVAYVARVTDFEYDDNYADAEDDESKGRYFIYNNDKLMGGIATGFGFTVRYGFIGLSFDYINGKQKTAYETKEAGQEAFSTTEKIAWKDLQLKLTFAL